MYMYIYIHTYQGLGSRLPAVAGREKLCESLIVLTSQLQAVWCVTEEMISKF